MHRRTDSRSPVQSVRTHNWLPFIAVALAAMAFWSWQQREMLVDWYDGELEPRAEGPRRATADLVQVFSTDDYPMDAIRREEQGTVGYHLTISRRGTVSACRILRSSGSEALDRQTCRILERRARFDPARNSTGKRMADEYSGRIRWELPEE